MLPGQNYLNVQLSSPFIAKKNYRSASNFKWRLVNPYESTHRLIRTNKKKKKKIDLENGDLETKSHFLNESNKGKPNVFLRNSTILGKK